MSKSYNNYIGITETPNEMYGKTMSIPDSLIIKYFECVTNINNKELDLIKSDVENNVSNPRDLKRRLSRKIVELYYDEKIAYSAEENFDNLFIKKAVPENNCIKRVYTMQITSHENALVFHESFKAGGYEGSILRTNDTYACKRSHNLRKFKDFSDAEATIVGYLDGKGKRTGTLGKFIMQDDNGVEFGCPPGKGYTYKQLGTMLENIGDYIGQRATFTFFERTKAGSYRHPLFKCIRNYE